MGCNMAIYSHSRLGTFETCPRQYWYAYVERPEVEDRDTVEAFLGSRVHEALENLHKMQLGGRLLTCADLVAWYEDQWQRQWQDSVLIVDKTFTADDYREVGREALKAYHRRYAPFDQERTLRLEGLIQIDLNGDGKYRMRGYVDRLAQRPDGTYVVHDYKTGRYVPTQADADKDRQLALYQIGVQGMWPDAGTNVELVWHYLRFDKELRSRRASEQLQEVRQRCIALIDDIEARGDDEASFPTTPTNLCDWCAYQHICPARKHPATVANLPPVQFKADDGVKLVDAWTTLRDHRLALQHEAEAIKQQEEALQQRVIAFAESQGLEIVQASDYQAQIRPELTLDYPKSGDTLREQFEQALRAAGLWDAVSALNAAKLLSRWNDSEAIPDIVRLGLRRFIEEQIALAAVLRRYHGREDR